MKLRRTGTLTFALVPLVAAVALSRPEPDAAADDAPTAPVPAVVEADAPVPAVRAEPPAPRTARDPGLEPLRRSGAPLRWAPEKAPFRLAVDGEPVLHRVMGVPALPGATVRIEVPGGGDAHAFRYQDGTAIETGTSGWRWTAPREPGVYAARVEGPDGTVALNLLVARPATDVRNGSLDGYRIGSYVKKPLRGLAAYIPPEGFVRVAEDERDVLVSPHFTLEQFLCKQPGEPRYVSYSAPLVRKLEALLEAVNERGIEAPTLHVMSGFRTPAYNRAIGNNTVYSRHLWGDAADVFVDADGNGDMDDLNGDGRSNIADARLLAGIADEVERAGGEGIDVGGMGVYRRNSAHGPFVHVDARGYRARW